MHFFENNKVLSVLIIIFLAILVILIANVVAIVYNGQNVPAPELSATETTIGKGERIKYLILGDSTAVAQGTDYSNGFAVATAEELAKTKQVTFKNFGVSGARIHDVATDQLERSKDFIPDLVLIAVGANDVTHLTSLDSIETSMILIINLLRDRNKDVKIVFTGAASMGDVKRFIQPLKLILGNRTKDVNALMEKLALENNVTFAYIAKKTGQKFAENPKYFAEDNFHPNNDGYAEWTRVLNATIDETIK